MNFRRSVVVWLSDVYVKSIFFKENVRRNKREIFILNNYYIFYYQVFIFIFKGEIWCPHRRNLKNLAIFKKVNS